LALPGGRVGAITVKDPDHQHCIAFATVKDRDSRWRAVRLCDAQTPGDIEMDAILDLNTAAAIAATGQTAAAVRVKISSEGYFIDHPDPALGDQLMADALGVADRDAMDGILRQLVKASANRQQPDAVNLAFMISMIRTIKPRDSVEAMLVAQMVSVHVMAMRSAYQLANAQDIARQDSAARALGRLARTFPAQMEALNRYRSNGAPAVTVQNVSVGDGGRAIVGNVTQHASVVVADNGAATAATDAPRRDRRGRKRNSKGARSLGVKRKAPA
jgi:hypothetical protein